MSKKLTAGILAGFLACSLAGGGYALLDANADVVGSNATDWGTMSSNAVYAADGFVDITGSGWGSRSWYTEKVKLDGLTIQMTVSNMQDNSFGGFYFANDQNAYFGDHSPVAFTHWQNQNGWGTNRFSVASNHDAGGAQLIYTDEACTQAGFGYNEVTYVMIMNIVPVTHYTISISSHNDTTYKVRVALSDANTLHTNHANYGSDESSYWCDGYMKKDTFASVLDANGCTTLCVAVPNNFGKYSVKIADDNIRAYQTNLVAPAQEKVTAYQNAQITDGDTYTAAMTARDAAVEAVNALKGREKAELSEAIAAVDAGHKTNETVQTVVKGLVQAKIDEAAAAFNALVADESTITNETLGAAKEKVTAAETEFASKQDMFSEATETELRTGITAINYASQKVSVLQWIVNYENAIAALDVTSDTVGESIAAVKATKTAFAGSALETALNGLEEADKTAYTARITAADQALAAKEEGAAVAVKTAYVVAFEATLEDLTSYSKITAAFAQKGVVEESVSLTEEDGELLTRFNNGVDKLYTALEKFISDAIAAVSTSLDGTFDTLASFNNVRMDYNSINLELLSEEREATETINAAYDALTEKLKGNLWYNFSQTGLTTVERNETGIYFEQPGPKYPDRLNYNKKLDLTKGVEVVVELTNIAYYNGDKTEDGTSKGANNLCINFSNDPNSYKAMSSGINIIIWLFETESSVDINNPQDASAAHGVIATPLNGGKLTISLRHGTYEDFASEEQYSAYVLTINGVEIVLSDTLATSNGINVNDECYFSFGSFADYKADPNCFTLVSVDGEKFAKEKPVDPDPTPNPDPTPDPDPDPTPDPKPEPAKTGCKGCGSELGAYSALASCLALGVFGIVALAIRSKKNRE